MPPCATLNWLSRRVSDEDFKGLGCFCFSKFLDNGRILFDIMFINSFKEAVFMFPWFIRTLNFLDILAVFLVLSGVLSDLAKSDLLVKVEFNLAILNLFSLFL